MQVLGAVVSSGVMTGYRTGAETRRRILRALLALEPRTIRGLADAANKDYSTIAHHLRGLESDGLVTVGRARGRLGAKVRLTTAGKSAAQMMEKSPETAS